MGHRTLKRVPMDFSAPLGKVWEGYINPFPGFKECPWCGGCGLNPESKKIEDEFYNFDDRSKSWHDKITQEEVDMLVKEKRIREDDFGPHPTAEQVNDMQRSGAGFRSHDGINRCLLVEFRAKKLGVYGKCAACKGNGHILHPDKIIRKQYKDWKEYEPPTGPGYQLWETCSEGSPVSPVFGSAEQMAEWCEDNATVFAHDRTSKERWLKMFQEEDGCDIGSMMIMRNGFLGAIINAPQEKRD